MVHDSRCRCWPCRAARAARERERRAGDHRLVAVGPVKDHLEQLAAAGMGTRQIAWVSGVGRRHIQAIAKGARSAGVRRETADRLLAVTVVTAPGAVQTGWWARRQVDALLAEGFSKDRIRRAAGLATLTIRDRIRVSTARAIRRAHDGLTA